MRNKTRPLFCTLFTISKSGSQFSKVKVYSPLSSSFFITFRSIKSRILPFNFVAITVVVENWAKLALLGKLSNNFPIDNLITEWYKLTLYEIKIGRAHV